jgi:4-hydroxy-tetrahydrodipicolinate synthase
MITANNLRGLTVATVLPFAPDLSIDWASYERLLQHCILRPGVVAVFVNGHAGEAAALSPAERIEVIRRTRAFVGAGVPLMAGIVAYSTAEAVERAREAESAGADIGVLFPFPQYGGGGGAHPQAGVHYVQSVLDAVGIPLSVFQYPVRSGAGFTPEVLCAIARLPRLLAIKEGSGDIAAYEDNWRAVKAAAPQVAILPSNYDWLLPQMAIGADGILSGLGSLVPDLLVDLWRATDAQDLAAMRRANDALYPVVRTIYGAAPLMDMHTRIKVGLQQLGVIDHAVPRPPLMPVPPATGDAVRTLVEQCRLPAFAGPRAG